MGVSYSPFMGSYTPICNECGAALCWDIAPHEYFEAEEFWNEWICRDCNGGESLSLKEWSKKNGMSTLSY